MKIFFISIVCCTLLLNISNAQKTGPIVIAVTMDGILVGKHVGEYAHGGYNYNTVMDTVDIKKVQGIYVLNGFYIDNHDEIHTLKATEFQMVILHSAKDTLNFKSHSEFLTKEMKEKLKTLVPGDRVFIQFIKLADEQGYKGMSTPLFFLLK